MNNESNFEIYLFIDKKKIVISAINKKTFKTIYLEQIFLENNFDDKSLKKLDYFLEKNIFKIEKILKDFIKSIYIILDNTKLLSIQISSKKQNNANPINLETLSHPLNNLKDLCQSNFQDQKIVHMIIENYLVDEKKYDFLPENLKCNNFSLNLKFICLSKNFLADLEKTLKKYHITINKVLSANYIENFIDKKAANIFTTASRIKSGLNSNEVLLVPKTFKNKGFFEKFFNFFS